MTNTNNNTATNTNPATNASVTFRAPINIKMPVTVNFSAPVNLTYNGASEVKPELPKITAEDLQRYIAEQLQGQCETVPAGWPAPIKPATKCTAPKNSDCTQIDKPIRDRKESSVPAPKSCNNVPTDKPVSKETGCGVAEATVENRIMDAIVEKFGVPRNWLVSITPFKSAYEHYAVGTTGDLTYVAWVHSDGRITVKQQAW